VLPISDYEQKLLQLLFMVTSSVVTVSLFSRSVGVSMKNSVPVSVFIHVHQALLYGFYYVQFGAVGLIGERVVCVRGAYCRAGEVVN